MILPCQIGFRCPYRWQDSAECGASWHGDIPDECPVVKEGSPLERMLLSYEREAREYIPPIFNGVME